MRYFFEVWEARAVKRTWLDWVMSTKLPGVGAEVVVVGAEAVFAGGFVGEVWAWSGERRASRTATRQSGERGGAR